jgi:hypothetical protein
MGEPPPGSQRLHTILETLEAQFRDAGCNLNDLDLDARAGRAVREGQEVQGAHDRMDRYGLPRASPLNAPHASPAGGGHADMQGLGVGKAEDRGPAAPISWAGGRCLVEDGACQAALLPDLGDRVMVREGRAAGRSTR